MNANTSTQAILRRIASILYDHQEPVWARAFKRFADTYEESPGLTKGQIRSVYGGMESFGDIVLQGPYGIPLQPENDELDSLRSQLYRRCQTA